jgi:hypothetical protein
MRHRESRRRQKLRVKSALMVILCTALTLVFLNGCRSNGNHGELISTSLSMSAYTEARQRANPGAQASMYYFPTLEIFNDAGVLVYRSHESIANAQILKDFPRSVRSLPPQEDAPRLAKILEQIPDFKPREQEIVGKKLVILSIGLENCGGCAVQEQALGDLKRRLLQQEFVAILEIEVAHP